MGNYNPHAPQILGQEWVPIRDVGLVYSPAVNSVEIGTIYNQTSAQRVRTARFYVNQVQPTPQGFQVGMVNVYPAGLEDQTGPISQVIIPCSSGAITGTNVALSNASSVQDAVFQSGDGRYIEFDANANVPQQAGFFFAVNQYPVLANKRILNVSLLYSGDMQARDASGNVIPYVDPTPLSPTTIIRQTNDFAIYQGFTGPTWLSNTGTLDALATDPSNAAGSSVNAQKIGVLNLGDVNNFWDSTTSSPSNDVTRYPWRYVDLQKFEASAANRQYLKLIVQLPDAGLAPYPSLFLDYMALRVIYCEEKRVAYGGQRFSYAYGMNSIALKDLSFNSDPVLPVGQYLPTLSWVSPGQTDFGMNSLGDFPILNAIEELYQIPSHPGVKVNVPFPLEDRIGSVFSSEVTHILPQLTLHASGGTLTDPHVYGRQAAAQVYGANTATQEIYDDISGVSASYPQVRYYARRFGDTTVPLTLTGSGALVGSTASITVADFDALAEILDGWREVTLRFSAAPTMGAVTGTPGWTWSAVGETAGNRWEVLAASAPAISGIPGNIYNLVPSPNQLGTGTYQPPSGDTVNLNWMPQGIASPWVTGASDDAATDAVLIFSQDPPTITGLALSAQTQTVTGIGLDCGTLPCCIPSGISYQQITWSPPGGSAVLVDFDARNSAGWGTATTGQAYTDSGGTVPGNYNVVAGTASHTLDGAANVFRFSTVAAVVTDSHQEITLSTNIASAGASMRGSLVGHFVDASNFDGVDFRLATSGNMEIVIYTVTAGVQTAQTNVAVGAYQAGQQWRCVVDFNGSRIRAKAWVIGTTEPLLYQAEGTALLTSGGYGVRSVRSTGNTNTTAVLSYVDYAVSPSTWNFGGYELQRFDTVTTEFETIMLASSAAQVSFNDFEARVGITSVYRIRSLNALNFAGQWSAMVSGAPPTPGVTGGCTNMTGALIFTSNADQSGASNAAYAMVWENDPIEDFKLAEADMVTFQPMYGRDGSIAFHGTERGLEAFDRTLLLQSAAIDPTRLADAKTIRDLAWNSLPYVCVRDDIGDRWFVNVRIPAVNARLNRTKYMARVEIVETTQTPYPVDP